MPDSGGRSTAIVEQPDAYPPTALITFQRNRYSVPASFANRPVSLRVYPGARRRRRRRADLCEHPRIIERSDHCRANDLRLAPLSGGDPAQARGAAQRRAVRRDARAFRRCRSALLKRPAATGRWWRSWRWSCSTTSRRCSCAVELALEAGVPTKTHILNLLHRLVTASRRRAAGRRAAGLDLDPGTAGGRRTL